MSLLYVCAVCDRIASLVVLRSYRTIIAPMRYNRRGQIYMFLTAATLIKTPPFLLPIIQRYHRYFCVGGHVGRVHAGDGALRLHAEGVGKFEGFSAFPQTRTEPSAVPTKFIERGVLDGRSGCRLC